MHRILFIVLLLIINPASGQDALSDQACISDEEYRLYKLINEYREEKGQPIIPLSASLSYVAGAHVWDLQENQPDNGRCNMHSWSENGPWSACCYTEDHKRADCVWAKPEQLTQYDDHGYEVAYYNSSTAEEHNDIANAALEGWKGSPGHNQIIINKYAWKRMKWNAMGVGIYGNYVAVWFGEKKDPAGIAKLCP